MPRRHFMAKFIIASKYPAYILFFCEDIEKYENAKNYLESTVEKDSENLIIHCPVFHKNPKGGIEFLGEMNIEIPPAEGPITLFMETGSISIQGDVKGFVSRGRTFIPKGGESTSGGKTSITNKASISDIPSIDTGLFISIGSTKD
jgi:hypothetical protein